MRVAAVQLTSTPNVDRNVAVAAVLIAEAAQAGSEFVALPELFNRWGSAAQLREGAEKLDGPTLTWARETAVSHSVWLLAGSIVESTPDGLFNTSCLINPRGEMVATYRKIHLFDVDIPGAVHRESATITAGSEIVVADAGPLRIGMATCYDLRFPELFRAFVDRRANTFVLPSAFTAATGKDHWDILVRARAIESQGFVIAPNQVGHSTPKLAWHGHSMIVDPWGRVLAEAADGENFITADLDLNEQGAIRAKLPSLEHRRTDVYGKTS